MSQPKKGITEDDKKEIKSLSNDVPLILTNEGWDAYADTFTMDYKNWSMTGEEVRGRKSYLGLVKNWFDQENRATGSTLKTTGFIPMNASEMLYQHTLEEKFYGTVDSLHGKVRDIRFVAVYKREQGIWKNSFTAFMDMPKL